MKWLAVVLLSALAAAHRGGSHADNVAEDLASCKQQHNFKKYHVKQGTH